MHLRNTNKDTLICEMIITGSNKIHEKDTLHNYIDLRDMYLGLLAMCVRSILINQTQRPLHVCSSDDDHDGTNHENV